MAKEIAVEILRLRRNAENHHHNWSNKSVKAITVVATEKIGIEGRVQFYEQTGALRDFVQGHLMQLLSLVLMRTPTIDDLPSQRLKALEYIQPIDPDKATRAQYEGYQKEVENKGSQTETFVAFATESDDPEWAGVPIRLATGKALSEKRSYVQIDYIDGTKDVFDETKLLENAVDSLDAYERVLLEAIGGRKDIFTSSPEVIRSWEIVTPLQDTWAMNYQAIPSYPVGMDMSAVTIK
jgi:glucose-6-phosphate 1-dehydrogenase